MAGMAPGYQPVRSEPPPCYNCGMRGHMFTACPEPTREIPAGLEASRARQQTGGDRGEVDHPNKRHKGPIVTRYPHPSDTGPVINRYHPMPQGQQFPFPSPHIYPPTTQHVPQPNQLGHTVPNYPPPHRPIYENYGPPPGQPAPPSQSYGTPAFGQPPYFGSLSDPPGPPGSYLLPGPPHYHQGPPQPFPPPQYPQQPPPYGYSGPSQGPPPGLPSGPPQSYRQGRSFALPQGPPEYSPPPHLSTQGYPGADFRPYPGPPHAPTAYSSNGAPTRQDPYRNERHPRYSEYGRDRSQDKHSSRDRRDDRRSGGWYTPGLLDDGGYDIDRFRDEKSYERERRGDQRSHKRRIRDGHGEEYHQNRRNERRDQHHSQNRLQKARKESEEEPLPLETPSHIAPGNFKTSENLEVPETNGLPQNPDVGDVTVRSKEELDVGTMASPANTSEEAHSEDDFSWNFKMIFQEPTVNYKGDAIGEPLPQEYSEKIMLPPAFDANGIKSKYIKPSNLDDFALSVRDTNHWSKYRYHPLFLAPTEITPKTIENYVRSTIKSRGHRNDHYDRFWRLPGFTKLRGRNHSQNPREQRDRRESYRQPDLPRKRKWEEHPHQADGVAHGWHQAPVNPMRAQGVEPRRHKDVSPEPGEISDAGSAPAPVLNHGTPPIYSKESSWPEWSDSIDSKREYKHSKSEAQRAYMRTYDKQDESLASSGTKSRRERDNRSSEPTRRDPRSRSPEFRGRQEERLRRSEFRRQLGRSGSSEVRKRRGRSYSPAHGRSPVGATRENIFAHIDQLYPPEEPREFPETFKGRGRDCDVARSPTPPPRRNSRGNSRESRRSLRGDRPTSHHGHDSRRSSFSHISRDDSPGSPLTPLEAELLGLAQHSSSESDASKKTPRRQYDDHTPKFQRRQPKVDAAYSRRW